VGETSLLDLALRSGVVEVKAGVRVEHGLEDGGVKAEVVARGKIGTRDGRIVLDVVVAVMIRAELLTH
jgi:hypothetical protein